MCRGPNLDPMLRLGYNYVQITAKVRVKGGVEVKVSVGLELDKHMEKFGMRANEEGKR